MASAGPAEEEAAAAREEQALRKLVVRLQNVQERKRLETLVQTLSDLLELAARQSAPRLFSGKNIHVPVLLVVDMYAGAAGVQQMGWSLLCKLIEICPSTLQNIAPKDVGKDWEALAVHQLILKMLTVHKGNVNLSVIGLKTLNLLLMSDVVAFLLLEEEVDVFSLIFNAMHIFPKNEEIQQHGCKALYKLFEKVPEEQLTEFVESKDHMIILEVFKEFPEREEVILPALYSLHSLAGPPSNVEVLMSGNVRCYNVIVETMTRFPSSETVQEACCCLLHKLTLAETIFLNRDLEERKEEEEEEKLCWLEACYRALELHRKNTDVLEAACWALKNLFLYQRNLHEKIGDGDNQFPIDRAVMLSMLMHSSSKEVFQAAASALAILSQQNGNIRKTLLSKGIHMNVLDIMRKHPHSPEVAESACRILNHVFKGSFPHLDIMTVAASEVVKAMRKHEKSLSVQLEALRVLLHFMMPDTKNDQNGSLGDMGDAAFTLTVKVIKSQCLLEGTHSLVLGALNRFQSLCCKCFAKIAENDDLKSMMLEKACMECNSIMAECLILLGADINKKTKTSSLIYQVCEKGSSPKLVELLLSNGAREQDVRSALAISIKRGDSQIISLLLKKLSLDIANSSICLGGFGIGRLEPSWLIPLFPDKLTPLRKQNAGSVLARMGPGTEYEPSVKQRRKLLPSDESPKGISKFSPYLRPSDSLSSLISEKEYIKSLDLSSNELENIDAISQNSSLTSHLEHLEKLELHQNALTNIPEQLCENLKCLNYLDLHSNRFTSFPTYLLKMNCIANLDISRNDIGPSFALDPYLRCPTLKQLNLSYNQLVCTPEFLANVAENLEQLLLEGNKISCICSPICLKELKILNISKNSISSLAENVFMGCTKLELFNARMNALVDLSQNKIISLPGPVHWKSLNLRELLFNHNQIGILDLSEKACAWSRLEKLHLSHNKLKEIPPQIGFLENLTSLDVSYNPDLRFFPDEMGRLSKIWDLPLEGLHLNFDFKHQRLKKAVPYNRMKLMIVGNTGSGKTTLLQQLMKCKRSEFCCPKATVGIDVKDWIIQGKGKMKKELILNVWDFGGQEEFYSTHPHFMTQRALYLAVYDLSKGQAEVDAMKPWLFNIKARASTSPVILVGTHLDVSDEKQHKACMSKITRELLNKRGFPAIQNYHFVNATEESDSIIRLRKIIIKESLHFKIRDQPVVGQLIPDSYLELEKRILLERKNVPVEFPVIDQKRLLELVQESQLQLDENELPHAIHFLNESGVLLHFQDPALQLRDLYFVDPKWLCKIMAQILTVKMEGFSKYPKGIVKRSDVEKFLLKKSKFPKIYMSQYFKLLEKFQIALPLGEDQLLIPSSLSDHRPVIELPHCENSEIIIRLYEMPYFPMGFWSRLINRLLEISPYMLSGRARALRPNRMYWRQGIYLNWSPEAYCLVESAVFDNNPDSFLKITAPSCRKGCILLGQVVDHIDSLMEEWFPGLLDIDVCGEGETLLKKWALYSFEDGEEHQKILLDDLLKKAEEGDLLVNPEQPRHTIPIAQIAPDLILADLPRNIMLNNDDLEFDKAPEFLLGDGGFGSVYRASYGGEEVAVKIFNKHTSLRLLRQELAVLCHLHHPSLVSLLAAAVRPRMLVMELALKGSLDRLLQQDKASLTRTLQHRIALHVADGLRYLHSAMIIYRDLKPHNVLLFTLYPNSAVIAKIADYGIAQYCCRMGIKTSEGTPGFRAPEVARGNVIYNQQADVYSFGLLLYDILTGGGRIMEGLKFPNEFDELAIQGKLPDPVKEYGCAPWPKVENLIKKCLKENPQERPTSSQVYDILNSAELICLMRYVSIPSTSTAECMVAANQSCKKAGVWIGNGNTEKAQLSFVNLNTDGHTCEDIADSKILSLALVTLTTEKENWIVAGTQSGSLWAVNTEDETRRHRLQKMSDSITCLYCNSLSKQSKQKNFFLVGTADGKLAVFEDRAVKCKGATPLKILTIGNVNTPLMCLNESSHLSEKNIIWGGCGTKLIALSSDFSVQKLIETKTSQLFCHKAYSDANIISIAVDKSIYLAKKNSHFVEIWDKKTEKLSELIDCAHFLKEEVEKLDKELKQKVAYSGRVKTICLQKNTALWIGTGGGHILLLDLSTRRPVRVIDKFCDSVRVMLTAQLGSLKNVVLVLGYCYKSDTEDDKSHKELQSCLSVWDINLPHEVQNLKKHIEMRQELAEKMKSFPLD
ncbi:Leucine-rich repeat serine/threonine-protein kinase 2 [Aix galericulata]|nr:Leucine-rich repeat serine/threonine-protein kinase 2 [Aix galericulata]